MHAVWVVCVHSYPLWDGEEEQRKKGCMGKGRRRGGGEREEIGNSNGCNIQYSVLSH